MELNKEIQTILLDYVQISIENNWTKEQMHIRSVYDTFRIQNIVKNLSLSGVVGQSEQLLNFKNEVIEIYENYDIGDEDIYRKAKSIIN